jgi:hypothetical protein
MASSAIRNFLDTGVLTADQIRNYLVDEGIFPKEFMQFDATSVGSSNDNDSYIADDVAVTNPLKIPDAIKKLYRMGPQYEAMGLIPVKQPSVAEATAQLQPPTLEVTVPGTETKDKDGVDIPGKTIPMPESIQKLYGYKSSDPRDVLQKMVEEYGATRVLEILREQISGTE